MKIGKRISDIFNANVNSRLSKMEDPEKMISLMIAEMKESLVNAKATTAENMANIKKRKAEEESIIATEKRWESRAQMAVEKGREELAREALIEKKRTQMRLDAIKEEIAGFQEICDSEYAQISELEKKLTEMKDKEHLLVARAVRAKEKKKIAEQINTSYNSNNITSKFDDLESKIEKLESEADISGFNSSAAEGKFEKMEKDDEIDKELEELKKSLNKAAKQ